MFKFLISSLCCATLSYAASSLPSHIDDLASPVVVLKRPGMYTVTLSTDIAVSVLDELRRLPSTERHEQPASERFESLLQSFIYPHPSTLNGVNILPKYFTDIVRTLRHKFRLSNEQLPYFSIPKDLVSLNEAADFFQAYIQSSLTALPTQSDTDLSNQKLPQIISQKLEEAKKQAQELLNKYRDFYISRISPFRSYDIEQFVLSLLEINTDCPTLIRPEKLKILEILTRPGFLRLEAPIIESRFKYSPKEMVGAYIQNNGIPSTIVLGCGHADSLALLESLGLKGETWCGACNKLPHAGAMTVSLNEPSADVICDLNHPDLWALPDGSVTTIYDETWRLGCYLPSTLDHIARVLTIGGEFHSNDNNELHPTGYDGLRMVKEALLQRGFVVAKEDVGAHILILRKTR